MKFSAEEITEAAKALASLYKPGNPIDRLLTRHIIPSGCYQQYKENGAEFLKKIWEQDAEGMNYAIEVYAAARKPHYPQIDSIAFTYIAAGLSRKFFLLVSKILHLR